MQVHLQRPVRKTTSKTTGKTTAPDASRRIPLILSVDDDPDVSRMIALRMRSFDVRVERAFFGTQGLCNAVQDKPDLIIMDLAMPNGDGQFVLECLKRDQQTRDIPVIVLTGKRDQQLPQQLLRSGAAQYLRKPISIDELVREIGRFIELRELRSD